MKRIVSFTLLAVTTLLLSTNIALAQKPDHAGKGKPGGGDDTPTLPVDKSICIDPGHGGDREPGTVTEFDNGNKLREADLNLDVALSLKDSLENESFRVAMTRNDDEYLTNNDRYTICNNEKTDVLISIHHNGSTDASVDYPLALYQQRNSLSLAEIVGKSITDEFKDGYSSAQLQTAKFPSGVLIESDMPSIMTEGYFLTSASRTSQLSTEEGHTDMVEREAGAIKRGINSYFGGQ